MTGSMRPKSSSPDSRDGRAYVLDPDVAFAVEVALATGRPLLLRGEPGSGKSSLPAFVARDRNWRYYEHVVTSRTTSRDLLWSFDAVRRLADAQIRKHGEELNDVDYVEPGVLWWAFSPESARRRGADDIGTSAPATDPNPDNAARSPTHAVVLIDEIDKADPDMPNGILVPLGSSEFQVAETRTLVRHANGADDRSRVQHLVVITTNEERELPQAFLRRCVVAWLPSPTVKHLTEVAELHLNTYEGTADEPDLALASQLAYELMKAREEAEKSGIRKPSTAEYLDAFQALRRLHVAVGSTDWESLRALTLIKVQQPRE